MTEVSPEVWRIIPRCDYYQASSHGRVRRNPALWDKPGAEALKPASTNGYLWVSLKLPDRTARKHYIHRVVCEAFNGPRPTPKHQVAHGDGVRANNRPENLRWATVSENHADKRLHGTAQGGQKNPNAKLTKESAEAILVLSSIGWSVVRLSRAFRVSQGCISHVRSGRFWKIPS